MKLKIVILPRNPLNKDDQHDPHFICLNPWSLGKKTGPCAW